MFETNHILHLIFKNASISFPPDNPPDDYGNGVLDCIG